MTVAFWAVGAALAAVYWVRFCWDGPSAAKSWVKTASVLAVAAGVLAAGGPWVLVAAVVACAAGDYLLSLDREPMFLAGVGAFALGHLLFVAAMFTHAASDPARLGRMPEAGVIAGLIVFGVVMVVILWRRAGDLRGAVVGYVPIILAMGIAALSLPATGVLELVLLGAVLFMVSDTVLAFEMFVLDRNAPIRRVTPFVVWVTYWCAVAGIGYGLSFG